jgi:hypothetical protein
MGFSRGKLPSIFICLYMSNGNQLKIINDFYYLGVVLTRTFNCKKAKYTIAKRFMYELGCDSHSSDIDFKPPT